MPPLLGIAVKPTKAPEHDGFVPVVTLIVTLGVTEVFTTTVVVPAELVQPFAVAVTL